MCRYNGRVQSVGVRGNWTVGIGSLVPDKRVVTRTPLPQRHRAAVALDCIVATGVVKAALGQL